MPTWPKEVDIAITRNLRALVGAAHTLVAAQEGAARRFYADWPQHLTARPQVAKSLPVTHALDGIGRFAVPATNVLVQNIQRLARHFEWRQTYVSGDFGERFLQCYGWSEWIGRRGIFDSDRIACGVLLLAADTEYPAHSHEAEEIYLPLAGSALWKSRDSPWTIRAPGECIYHPPWMPHAMRTRREPLLALYVWRSGDLTARSRIEP